MNTHAFVAIVAAVAISGCGKHSAAVQQGQTPAPIGRYQAVAMPRSPGEGFDSALIVDTRDGHLWQWLGSPSSGPQTIRYMGQVTPSAHMGDVIEQKGD